MSEIRFSVVDETSDHNLRAAIRELEIACGVSSDLLRVIQFLMLCVYSGLEHGKRIPISTKCLASAPFLDSRVGTLPDGDLRALCAELAAANRKVAIDRRNIDFHSDLKLAAFLNKMIPKQDRPKKPTAKQAQMDRIVRLRRSNRR